MDLTDNSPDLLADDLPNLRLLNRVFACLINTGSQFEQVLAACSWRGLALDAFALGKKLSVTRRNRPVCKKYSGELRGNCNIRFVESSRSMLNCFRAARSPRAY